MGMSYQQELCLVEAAITKRLSGDAYDGYQEGPDAFRGAPLEVLFARRDKLVYIINQRGPIFQPVIQVREDL